MQFSAMSLLLHTHPQPSYLRFIRLREAVLLLRSEDWEQCRNGSLGNEITRELARTGVRIKQRCRISAAHVTL